MRNHLSKQSLHLELGTRDARTLQGREGGRSWASPPARDLAGGSPRPSRIGALTRP